MKSHSQHTVSGAADKNLKAGTHLGSGNPARGVRAYGDNHAQPDASARRPYLKNGRDGVALVITLLMLSVITFLAVAFLSMTQRNRASIGAGLDQTSARTLADAAQARAEAEIMANMLAHGDPYYYDYMVSQFYRGSSNNGPTIGSYDPNNANYEYFLTQAGGNYNSSARGGAAWAQNIANLYYDPCPPVFIVTNPALYPANSDFRFWVDINRNGRFETNGFITNILDNGKANTNSLWAYGEPEWIGILRDPLHPHSSSNQFIGRYAYMVLPIGKTLDLNYIGNFLKGPYIQNSSGPTNNSAAYDFYPDGFARDQGIGSWELNLAGVFEDLNQWAYETPMIGSYPGSLIRSYNPYTYNPPEFVSAVVVNPNSGSAFSDAQAIIHYRYGNPFYGLATLQQNFQYFGSSNFSYAGFQSNVMDLYCLASSPTNYIPGGNGVVGNFPAQTPLNPWPGSYQTNLFFDIQDLFDPTKTSAYFTNRLLLASERTNSYDRYTFQRLLTVLGTGSTPEYGVWINNDYFGYTYPTINQSLRTKVNINFDNSSQIRNPRAPYVLMPNPTNLYSWSPIGFFTNAAELLLRSQTFGYSNIIFQSPTMAQNASNPVIWAQFGLTNIPIYRTNQPGIRYNASVHRMLQLAANIYDATVDTHIASASFAKGGTPPPFRYPSVFRPVFGLGTNGTNIGINITGYVQMSGYNAAAQIITNAYYDLPTAYSMLLRNSTLGSNINIWGIPWIVGANKGLPQFYQYSYDSGFIYQRKLLFQRAAANASIPNTNVPPQYTNQFYTMSMTNNFGMDAFNPYPTPFTGSIAEGGGTSVYISNFITITITNNYNSQILPIYITNVYPPLNLATKTFQWTGWSGGNAQNGFQTFFNSNMTILPPCYYSESQKALVLLTNGFLAGDLQQTHWPVYNWTVNITNHVVYALFDGPLAKGVLLDYVNLGPFGSSLPIEHILDTASASGSPGGAFGGGGSGVLGGLWVRGNATDAPNSPASQGMLNQIQQGMTNATYQNDMKGVAANSINLPYHAGFFFGDPAPAIAVVTNMPVFVANDPMVHYTIDDLINPGIVSYAALAPPPVPMVTNTLGVVNATRYLPWGANGVSTIGSNDMLYRDPLMFSATNWDFPTNKFPGIGWLGRVHRGTPWQTIYLKADNPANSTTPTNLWASSWVTTPWFAPEHAPETYPTNDWKLLDLFTCAPNDDAVRGLLSVNQTNVAAWAALYAGVMAPTNSTDTTQILPGDVYNLVDASVPNTINDWRANYTNGVFHHIGEILGAPALTTQSPFLAMHNVSATSVNDEIVERIPQQTMGLVKLGEPQFVILSWGQSLKPKGAPYLGNDVNKGIYTNYEITGEFETRTVCHLVHTNGLKMVVDSFNVENGGN